MAIFLKEIKGLNRSEEVAADLFTYICFSGKNKESPSIKVDNTDLGLIVTDNAKNQEIKQQISILTLQIQDFIVNEGETWSVKNNAQTPQTFLTFKEAKGFNIQNTKAIFTSSKSTEFVEIKSSAEVIDVLKLTKGNLLLSDGGSITVTGTGGINSPYFNATSDKRAKENLVPITADALKIINSIKVYGFNYKDNPQERTVGVIAQEFLDKNFDNFSFVANKDASGEKGDYMSIKETKLIYLLIKAVQEQQEEIEVLKQKLENR